MYKQRIKPNLDPVIYQGDETIYNWVGWCLAYVQFAFKAGWAGSTAWDAWQHRLKFKHANRNIPKGVFVPLWFSGFKGMGHTLIVKLNKNGSGTAWTSPNNAKYSADVIHFANLNSLIQKLKRGWSWDLEYEGWSLDIGGKQVIEPKPQPKPKASKGVSMDRGKWSARRFIKRTYWLVQGVSPDKSDVDFHVSKSNPESFVNGFKTPLWKRLQKQLKATQTAQKKAETQVNKLQDKLDKIQQKNEQLQSKVDALTGSTDPVKELSAVELFRLALKKFLK